MGHRGIPRGGARALIAGPRAGALAAVALAATLFSIAACAEFKDTVSAIGEGVGGFFDDDPESQARAEARRAEALFAEAGALRDAGSFAAAFDSFLDAAELGHAGAAYELGRAYNDGRGVDRDLEAAARWFNVAAALGDARAQFLVGAAYYAGAGVAQDFATAAGWLAKAADQGHARAQYLLGEAFADGNGVARDPAWAARWYGKAAAQGHVAAQFAYGVVNAAGLGLPRNGEAAYAWLGLAAAGGHAEAARVRDAVARTMASAAIERAGQRIARFAPATPAVFADAPTVIYVQQALSRLGYDPGAVDGVAGARTRRAISAYQAHAGVPADGKLSPALVERLVAATRVAAR